MNRSIFTKLFALFVLLLVLHTVVMELVFHRLERGAGLLPVTGGEELWAGLIALLVAVPLALWAARGVSARVHRVVEFSRRIADGDLTARLITTGEDELAEIEHALNQTAERLGQNFNQIETQRAELAAMLNGMQEAVVAVGPDGTVRWSNAVMRRVAGVALHEGRPLIHAVRDPELLSCLRGALDLKETHTGRSRSLAPGRVFEINATPLADGGAVLVLHDLTRIEAAEKSRREFVANVSHELRTPLTSIKGYVETLVEEPGLSESQQDFLEVVLKNTSRISRLTEDLLALATIEGPDYRLALRPVEANKLVDEALEALGGTLIDSSIELENSGAPSTSVLADPDVLAQVFGNLVVNAIRYAGEGKRIRVGARQVENAVEFFVQDFGPGIASEHHQRIFERLYRVDKARARDSGGTGLGLAIVKHIVQVHGGHIWVESELGQGANFKFTLPAAGDEPKS